MMLRIPCACLLQLTSGGSHWQCYMCVFAKHLQRIIEALPKQWDKLGTRTDSNQLLSDVKPVVWSGALSFTKGNYQRQLLHECKTRGFIGNYCQLRYFASKRKTSAKAEGDQDGRKNNNNKKNLPKRDQNEETNGYERKLSNNDQNGGNNIYRITISQEVESIMLMMDLPTRKYRNSSIVEINNGIDSVRAIRELLCNEIVKEYTCVTKSKKVEESMLEMKKVLSKDKSVNIVRSDRKLHLSDGVPVTFIEWEDGEYWWKHRLHYLLGKELAGRDVEIFLLAPPELTQKIVRSETDRHSKLISGNEKYTLYSILYTLAFDTKIVGMIPIVNLNGKNNESAKRFKQSTIQGHLIEENVSCVLHMRMKRDFHRTFDRLQLAKFRRFLWKTRRVGSIISVLENCIPGCGFELISMGFTYNDKATTLSPREYLNIFQAMEKWEMYKDSPMHVCVTHTSHPPIHHDDEHTHEKHDKEEHRDEKHDEHLIERDVL